MIVKSDIEPFGPYALVLAQCEINMLQAALDQYSGDAEAAASSLRISEQFFRARAQVLGVSVGPPAQAEITLPETPVAKSQAQEVPPEIAQIRQERRLIAAAAIHKKPAPVSSALEEREALAAALLDDDDDDED